ncbi:MAG: hypothetical protein M3157_06565 [Actinomycetota bacterium]|nr:hypothetical protein [Actinomycetota bacterium]
MSERTGDFEWRGEGEGAEILLYAPDDSALERARPATLLPGIEGPVYAASSQEGFGLAAVSSSHVAPDLVSMPARGLLLVAGVSVGGLGIPYEEVPRLVFRNLSEVSLPDLGGVSGVGKYCDSGARRAAEQGLVEEEDLVFLEPGAGESDALGRRALEAGSGGWDRLAEVGVYAAREVLDAGGAERLDIGSGALVISVDAGAGDLGRLALAGHRHRIMNRVRGGDFGADLSLPAAPVGSGEAEDLLAAVNGVANFADGRAALTLYALRRALSGVLGGLRICASWKIGGFEERDGSLVQRRNLAGRGAGEACVCGDVVAGTDAMLRSVPPFGVPEEDGVRPWEEAGVLERWVDLELLGSSG